MEIRLYNFDKKKNSTRQPTEGNDERGVLKNPSSVSNPRIEFNGLSMGGNPTNYNYAFIAEFNRYYFIKEWSYESALWVAEMECDVLASFKADIVAQNYYILRTSTAFTGEIADGLYPTYARPRRYIGHTTKELFPEASAFTKGTYVVGISGADGVSDYYKFTFQQFKKFSEAVFSSTTWIESGDFGDLGEDIAKLVFNPTQYITSVKWFPYTITSSEFTVVTKIKIGWWSFNVTAELLGNFVVDKLTTTIKCEHHPQASSRGVFLDSFPYRRAKLFIQGFGMVELNCSKIRSDSLSIEIHTDCRTGTASAYVYETETNYILANLTGKVGYSIAIGDIKNDFLGAIANGAGFIANTVAGNFIGAGASLINAGVEMTTTDVNTLSNADSPCSMLVGTTIFTDCWEIVDEDNADNGRPYMKNGTPSTMGKGYYIVENGNIAIKKAYSEEKDEIKNYLEKGWYYE